MQISLIFAIAVGSTFFGGVDGFHGPRAFTMPFTLLSIWFPKWTGTRAATTTPTPAPAPSCHPWEVVDKKCVQGQCAIVISSFDGQRYVYCECYGRWYGNQCERHPWADDTGSFENGEALPDPSDPLQGDPPELDPVADYKVAATAIGLTVLVELVIGAIVLG